VERTAELVKASDQLRWEIAERRDIKVHLLDSEAALRRSLLSAADRASAKLPDAKGVYKQMLRGISPIGETSPLEAQLSSE
jgi:hypothetical protein